MGRRPGRGRGVDQLHPLRRIRPHRPDPAPPGRRGQASRSYTGGEGGSRLRVVPVETRGKRAPADGVLEAVPTYGHHIERYDDHDTVPGFKGGGRGLTNKCGSRMRVVPVEMRGKRAPADGVLEAAPTCGHHMERHDDHDTAPGCKGGGRGLMNKCDEMRAEVSREGVPTDGFEGSVARCGFRNPKLVRRAQIGAAASCVHVAGRGGGGGRGHRDTYAYDGTSRARRAAPSTADPCAKIHGTESIEGLSGSFTLNNVQVFAGYDLNIGSFLEGPDSKALPVGDEVKCKDPETRKPRVNIRSDKDTCKDRDNKGLGTIGEEVKQLAQRARDSSLKPQDLEGGTLALSNLGGPFGIRQFCAIINPPQSAILAIGSGNHFLSLGGHDDKKVMLPTQHALSVKMDNNGEDEISLKKEGSQPSDIHGSSTLDGSHAEFRTFSEVPDFVCSDRGGLFGSKKRKLNYISKMNNHLRADCVSDINPISNREARRSYSLRYEELNEMCCNLEVSVLLSTCASIKSSGVDTVTQIFMDICGLTIFLRKNLSKLDINMLSEAAFVRVGIKPKDFYSTFAGNFLEPKRLLSLKKEGSQPSDIHGSDIHGSSTLDGSHAEFRTFSEVPDFVCSDRGGLFGSKKRKLNYISKMNNHLRADCVSDINPISNREARRSYSLRYEELKEMCCNLAEVSVLLSTCASIKSSGVDTVTQIFMDICGLTIPLRKNLSKLDINMLSEAAFVRVGIKPKDFYSTFAGNFL